ncbi:hypothetical protein GCM10022222_06410 [Amycolatopsis ultiminotia]|uniref:FAD/NAD(P)-binding domain-containing protein n=1 Tax=Amycolatopsis ultiminotia TaxID=543629 RepID=A0ABP6V022_9PSEU
MVVVGGGYGGIEVAKALDDVADVVLVEPRDTFVHHVAALRALTDARWSARIFLPYQGLLRRGRIVRDRAARVSAGLVELESGTRLDADHLVLATGSGYPFPAKFAEPDAAAAQAHLARDRAHLAEAERVVLFGAGPVGLELAGEIVAAWPAKPVTLVDPAADLLTGAYPGELRDELRRQLTALGVELVLGAGKVALPATPPGSVGGFEVALSDGTAVGGDLWFRCFGSDPESAYLDGELAAARDARGRLAVDEHLRLAGHDTIRVIGDLTAVDEPKTAKAAGEHARVVAADITAEITGAGERTGYRPGPPSISLPLGPDGGASYTPQHGVLGAEATARIKGTHLRLDSYLALLGATAAE